MVGGNVGLGKGGSPDGSAQKGRYAVAPARSVWRVSAEFTGKGW
jgi:hypothetical protein